MTRRRSVAAPVALLLLVGPILSGCSDDPSSDADDDASPSVSTDPGGCPARRAEADPDRPAVDLEFRLADDLRTVRGSERVTFTPDLETDELVFRLTPNGPTSAPFGNRLTVTDVSGKQVEDHGYESADAYGDTPGGLLVVDLDDPVEPGESVEVSIDFELELGDGTFDRFGTIEAVSWWASGYPLLAWEDGVGWSRDPFVEILGETAVSPVADTTVAVDAPEDLEVLMTGAQERPEDGADGRRIWRSHEPFARDVSVAAGQFVTAEASAEAGAEGEVAITVGVLADAGRPEDRAEELADDAASIIEEFEDTFGAFPYATLSIPVLPDFGGGIEYPSSILLASSARVVLVHEIAHMWFYGMVGNSQFRDPWLDESFATFAESLVLDRSRDPGALALTGEVGDPMSAFADTEEYFDVVYGKGAAALAAAREAAGAEDFDAALRCYLDAHAYRIAVPDDVALAFADLPEASAVLEEAGALT